jgi:hypothetical protein
VLQRARGKTGAQWREFKRQIFEKNEQKRKKRNKQNKKIQGLRRIEKPPRWRHKEIAHCVRNEKPCHETKRLETRARECLIMH